MFFWMLRRKKPWVQRAGRQVTHTHSQAVLAHSLSLRAEGQAIAAPKPLAIPYLRRPDKTVRWSAYRTLQEESDYLLPPHWAEEGLPPPCTHRPGFPAPGEGDLRLLVGQEKGQMGLDGRETEL